jgi:hypothetical protein
MSDRRISSWAGKNISIGVGSAVEFAFLVELSLIVCEVFEVSLFVEEDGGGVLGSSVRLSSAFDLIGQQLAGLVSELLERNSCVRVKSDDETLTLSFHIM